MNSTLTEIYTERTPNPEVVKFVADRMLVNGPGLDFSSNAQNVKSPLAKQLFQFPFVTNIFIAANYVAITKIKELEWDEVMAELRDFIKRFLNSGNKVLEESVSTEKGVITESANNEQVIVSEIEIKINNILNEYIKPAVEQDGGAIVFRSFKDGIVTVAMQGACSGCPSSTMTLKAGIEGLLKRMVPEVNMVVAESC